jgi:hypothetical protein
MEYEEYYNKLIKDIAAAAGLLPGDLNKDPLELAQDSYCAKRWREYQEQLSGHYADLEKHLQEEFDRFKQIIDINT